MPSRELVLSTFVVRELVEKVDSLFRLHAGSVRFSISEHQIVIRVAPKAGEKFHLSEGPIEHEVKHG